MRVTHYDLTVHRTPTTRLNSTAHTTINANVRAVCLRSTRHPFHTFNERTWTQSRHRHYYSGVFGQQTAHAWGRMRLRPHAASNTNNTFKLAQAHTQQYAWTYSLFGQVRCHSKSEDQHKAIITIIGVYFWTSHDKGKITTSCILHRTPIQTYITLLVHDM